MIQFFKTSDRFIAVETNHEFSNNEQLRLEWAFWRCPYGYTQNH